jgi:hypothetical protein
VLWFKGRDFIRPCALRMPYTDASLPAGGRLPHEKSKPQQQQQATTTSKGGVFADLAAGRQRALA